MIAEQLAYDAPAPLLLLEAIGNLVEMVEDDPVSMLAQAAQWLLPVPVFNEDGEYEYEEDEALSRGCGFIRERYFDRWCEALDIRQYRGDQSFELVLRDILCDELYVNVYDPFGYVGAGYMPYSAVGVDIEGEDYPEHYELYHFITDLIGIDRDSTVQQMVAAIVRSLEALPGHIYENVAMTLRWLYTGSGNTLFDYSDEEVAEFGAEPFSWDMANEAFELQQEAFDYLDMSIMGRKILEADPLFFHCFESNIKYAKDLIKYGVIEPMKVKEGVWENVKYDIPLDWAAFNGESSQYRSETQAHAVILRPWRVHPNE